MNDLCDGLAMTQQAVPKHFAILELNREAPHYHNSILIPQIGERWIKKFERGKFIAFGELKQHLKKRDE